MVASPNTLRQAIDNIMALVPNVVFKEMADRSARRESSITNKSRKSIASSIMPMIRGKQSIINNKNDSLNRRLVFRPASFHTMNG